ncbi:phosphatase PAP2 family protein [Variovorax sp. Sphag1AA]|uniref:phosphatase PAP2 family protein n=1 Tax=Variovorax sp. Sphag1AA TaxID=2587027 RepID=UPI00180A7690|nr:phosphatase PAP2 family protein [Variovorax sp. Sphag1AA]MBB3181188.1 membrane-associated phospholipid phosphatase [Variovorax sp. Sphag1AA]
MATIAVAWLLGWIVEALCNAHAYHDRPFAAGFGPALVHHAANNSMPSSHVTFVWVIAAVFAMKGKWSLSAVLTAFGFVLAWARIYVGIHWPLDMIMSAVVAIGSAAFADLTFRTIANVMRRA